MKTKKSKLPPKDRQELPPEQTDEFIAPDVHIGQVVIWHAVGRTEEHPAIITRINRGDGSGTIAVSVISPQRHTLESTKVAVYHEDDPRIHEENRKRDGVWRLNDQDKTLRELILSLEGSLRKSH